MNTGRAADDHGRVSVWLLVVIPLAVIAFATGFVQGMEIARMVVVGLIVVTISVMVLVRILRGPPVNR